MTAKTSALKPIFCVRAPSNRDPNRPSDFHDLISVDSRILRLFAALTVVWIFQVLVSL